MEERRKQALVRLAMTAGLFTAALILVIGAAVLWFARKAGRDSVRADNAETAIKSVEKVRADQNKLAAGGAAERDRVWDEWTRP